MWDKFKARRRLGRQLSLWYHPCYEAPSLANLARSLGMVALRGRGVLAQLTAHGLVRPGDLQAFPLVSLADLALFHSPDYLERVGQRETLARIFGLPPAEVKVDEILGAVRWAVSGTLAAARAALAGLPSTAVNLGGGFHHAEPNQGSGFCVYNDIGVAIRKLRAEGFAKNIVIIDLDFHQGNGNIVGFCDDPTVNNYSLHGAVWTDREGVGNFNRNFEGKIDDAQYLQTLEATLPQYLTEHSPGLAFYIAGHDVLLQDSLGEFSLSLAGAERRDRWVLQLLQERGIPGVVTLGGGYSAEACQATLDMIRAALDFEPPLNFTTGAESSPSLRKVLARIDPSDPQFQSDPAWRFSETDLWPNLDSGNRTVYEVERKMENSGFFEKFRNRGFEDFRVSVEGPDLRGRKIRVTARRSGKGPAPLESVAELDWEPDGP